MATAIPISTHRRVEAMAEVALVAAGASFWEYELWMNSIEVSRLSDQ
jgi:hypothetical protein